MPKCFNLQKFLLFCFALLFIGPVFAQTGPVVEIDKIVITESQNSAAGIPVTTAPSQRLIIKSSAPKQESAADVVSQMAGVHVQRYGGLEEATSISIRGSSNSQVNVFLDGIPLETASGQGVQLSNITAKSLSKIEVYKSLTPSDFGGSAIGGVVNLKPKDVEAGWTQRYGLGLGSFFTFDVMAETSFGGKKNETLFGIDYRRTRGDFTFLDNNGTPLNFSDDQRVKRQNNHKQVIHPYMSWQHRFDKNTTLKHTQHFFRIDSGVPGLENFQSQTASVSTTEWQGSLSLAHKGLFQNKASLTDQLFLRIIKSQFSDLNAEIGLGQAQDTDNKTVVAGDRLIWQTDITENLLVKKGAEYLFEWFLPRDYVAANPQGSSSSRHQLNFFLEPHFYFYQKKILLSFKGQSLNTFYDVNNNDASLANANTFFSNRTENQVTGTVALDVEPFKKFHVKTSLSRDVRLPKFVEMFGDQGFVLGNPQLTSEKSVKGDFGFSWWQQIQTKFWQGLRFETSYFVLKTDDLIQFEMASGYARATNIGKAEIHGIETMLLLNFGSGLDLATSYTFQRAKDNAVNAGNFLVGRPEQEVNSRLGFHHNGLSAGLAVNFIDNQYLDALNTQRIDNRLVLNFDVGYLMKERYRIGLEAKNMTNSQIYDAVGFPLPGRSFFGRLDIYY